MGLLEIEGVTHWSIPVNNIEESEKFYRLDAVSDAVCPNEY